MAQIWLADLLASSFYLRYLVAGIQHKEKSVKLLNISVISPSKKSEQWWFNNKNNRVREITLFYIVPTVFVFSFSHQQSWWWHNLKIVLQWITIILISCTMDTVECPTSHSGNLYGFVQNVVQNSYVKEWTNKSEAFCTVHLFSIRNEKPTGVTVSILFIYRRISTCFGPTGPSSGEFTQLFTQPLVQYPYRSGHVFCMYIQNTRPERYGYWTNGCGNSCVSSPEDGPVGPKHVEIRRYMNKIETVTSVGFSFLIMN